MVTTNIGKHYLKMKKILNIIESGNWQKHQSIAKMTIEQVENMKKTVLEFEKLGINRTLKQAVN